MRFVSYTFAGQTQLGILHSQNQSVHNAVLSGVPELKDVLGLLQTGRADQVQRFGPEIALADVIIGPPILRPRRNIFCIGKNYRDHVREVAKSDFYSAQAKPSDADPEYPIVFTKTPETVIGTNAAIPFPHGLSSSLDYEAELAVIIGKQIKSPSRDEAEASIFGLTILNDVTARDLQQRHKQWFLGKSLDGFCPLGPSVVTADEVNYRFLQIKLWVNDELRQNGNTRDMIFDVPQLIQTLAQGMTLYPGDIIATGTPDGVGVGFSPPRFLKPGDEIKIEIEGLGQLKNRVD